MGTTKVMVPTGDLDVYVEKKLDFSAKDFLFNKDDRGVLTFGGSKGSFSPAAYVAWRGDDFAVGSYSIAPVGEGDAIAWYNHASLNSWPAISGTFNIHAISLGDSPSIDFDFNFIAKNRWGNREEIHVSGRGVINGFDSKVVSPSDKDSPAGDELWR
ncbi:hypothetical protein ACLIN3_05595 [Pseudomonas orientalis]|uniref:hypothetical protein n=1 Tax=Pseudomonas orientalis TaxID=76758 RepID=UPI003986F648